MNWARGFFRLWLVLSVLWIALLVAMMRPDQEIAEYKMSYAKAESIARNLKLYSEDQTLAEKEPEVTLLAKKALLRQTDARIQRNEENLIQFVAIGLGFPGALLLIGASLFWAIGGFRKA